MIFNTQRFSTHDGPGIRTLIFFKGCPLSCPWCQNPESRSPKPQLMFDERLCIQGCRRCCDATSAIRKTEDRLIIERQKIRGNQLEPLRDICPSQALNVIGQSRRIDELLSIALKDRCYYESSGGGITLSGGEPLLQTQFICKLLTALKNQKIHTLIESCLSVPWHYIEPVLKLTDGFLADLKHTDDAKFRDWCQGSLSVIKENLIRLKQAGASLTIRIPVIPGFNASLRELNSLLDFIATHQLSQEVHLLPYHLLGAAKYPQLGLKYTAPVEPLEDPELLASACRYAQSLKLTPILKG
ncbi:glycyl-radical enzyme activating protein [Dongshaea marina]|uniref:glycyl-radical enzyme activating protein n=1 Tax=Dongshaea marina TaxID=2047966 RepID=UPI000D3EA1DF|nr:glycyl-radical enzyme activating protein [Dongshaea marina]